MSKPLPRRILVDYKLSPKGVFVVQQGDQIFPLTPCCTSVFQPDDSNGVDRCPDCNTAYPYVLGNTTTWRGVDAYISTERIAECIAAWTGLENVRVEVSS